jgi:hypothetical protein
MFGDFWIAKLKEVHAPMSKCWHDAAILAAVRVIGETRSMAMAEQSTKSKSSTAGKRRIYPGRR